MSEQTTPNGFKRDETGILCWMGGGASFPRDLTEQIKIPYAGRLLTSCNESVFKTWSNGPCGNTPKHDPDANGRPTKCGHHSAAGKAKREAKRAATDQKWRDQSAARTAVHNAEVAMEAAIRRIAEGHNDPRSLALEVVAQLDAARAAHKAAHSKAQDSGAVT